MINPLEPFNPVPALNNYGSVSVNGIRCITIKAKAKEQEWFAGVFSRASAEIGCLPENPSKSWESEDMEMELE